jgi:hypothetical protein
MRPTLIFAAVAAACGALVAPTGIASAEQSAVETIGLLEAEGYYVNIDRIGSAPLDECIVTSIRNPHTVTKLVRVDRGRKQNGGRDFDLVVVVVSKSIQVSLDCTRPN